jgi:quercetin dioxygenase-like cupin family protein
MRASLCAGDARCQVSFPYLNGNCDPHNIPAAQPNKADAAARGLEKVMHTLWKATLSAIVCSSFAQAAVAQEAAPHAIFRTFNDLKWEKTPDGFQDIVILHVNPISKASELIIRAPKGFHVPRHSHSANETLTVLSGTFTVKHDGSDEKVALNPGSYSYMPAKMVHEAWAGEEGATFFVTVDSAWDLNFVE